jgi:integrase-like protein
MALEQGQTGRRTAPADRLTLIEFGPTYRSDAVVRLEENTVADYEGTWRRRVEPRFGNWRLDQITPRAVSLWRADMQNAGVGQEAIRKAMVLLQAMFIHLGPRRGPFGVPRSGLPKT